MGGNNKINTDKILDFIKASNGPVNKKQIVAATGYKGDFKYAMKKLAAEYDEIKVTGATSNTVYSWVPAKAIYSEIKNPEGYNDFTAGKAIGNVMKSSGKYPMRQDFGEVWSSSNVLDEQEGYLIISAKEGICLCYGVYPLKKPFMKPDYTMRWTDEQGNTHYVSTINIVNISEKKLGKRIMKLNDAEKECLSKCVASALSIDIPAEAQIQIVEKPVEKIVEVEKPVEVEVVKEVPVEVYKTDPAEIEMAVLKAKCEIYERLIFSGKAC